MTPQQSKAPSLPSRSEGPADALRAHVVSGTFPPYRTTLSQRKAERGSKSLIFWMSLSAEKQVALKQARWSCLLPDRFQTPLLERRLRPASWSQNFRYRCNATRCKVVRTLKLWLGICNSHEAPCNGWIVDGGAVGQGLHHRSMRNRKNSTASCSGTAKHTMS